MFLNAKRQGVLAVAAALALSACSVGSTSAIAQGGNSSLPVLIVGEDSDPNTVKRSSDIFKRVIAQMKESMKRYDFRVVDEEAVNLDLGFVSRDRRPKQELIDLAKQMTKSGEAKNRVRALVLFRIHASAKDAGFATKVRTRINGEIYDTVTNEFLGTFEMPEEKYPAPADCLQNKLCITETVGARSKDIAASLGTILAKKLNHLHNNGSRANDDWENVNSGNPENAGLPVTYTVTLSYFGKRESSTILGVMKDEFPHAISYDLLSSNASVRKYEYRTRAKAGKLDEWLTILLSDMNYDVEEDVNVTISGTNIRIDKLNPTNGRPISEDEKSRFQ